MGQLFSRAKLANMAWVLSIMYIILFSIGSFTTSAMAALTGKHWSSLSGTDRVIIICAIAGNWSNSMLAFINQAITRIRAYTGDEPVAPTERVAVPQERVNEEK